MQVELSRLRDERQPRRRPGAATPSPRLRPAIEDEFALLRARDFERAEADGRRRRARDRGPAQRSCAPPPSATARSPPAATASPGSAPSLVMALLVVGLTALLGLLDRAGRRRLRDDHLRRLAFEDSLDRPPEPRPVRAAHRRDAGGRRARRRRLPGPGRLQAGQRLARPRRRRPAAGDLRRAPAQRPARRRHRRPAGRRRVRDPRHRGARHRRLRRPHLLGARRPR